MSEGRQDGTSSSVDSARWSVTHRARSVGWGIGLIVVGTLWLLVIVGVPMPWDVVLPTALIAVGLLVLIVGRRARGDGLISLGFMLALVALLASFTPGSVTLTAGDRQHRLTDLAELGEDHSLGAGSLTLDLRDLELPDGITRIDAGVTFGELIVRVPPGVAVAGSARAAIGEVDSLEGRYTGVGPRARLPDIGTLDGPVLDLDVSVGFGRLEVSR